MIMKRIFILFTVILISVQLFGQGTLMLVGGGTERSGDDAWNYDPYRKAVSLSENKRVAIIAWGAESDSWLRDYFTGTCNAIAAKHFDFSVIDPADYDTMYDSLMTYDMLFFKGGDQNDYYSNFKNTAIADAITDKYTGGGVISGTSAGMAILSSVMYTAENGTVYPYEAIENYDNTYMTLANDFVDLASGWLFDTHFAERGRFPRLVGLITNWYYNQSEVLTGLGVDDVTAMIIRNDSIYAYGTGAGNFFDIQNAIFDQNETMVVAEDIKVTNILNGCTMDLNTGNIEGLSQVSNPEATEENHTFTLLLGGGIYSTYHTDMMETLVNECGEISDDVLFITGTSSSNAAALVNAVESASTGTVYEFEGIQANANNQDLENAIASSSKFVFVDNDYTTFMNFMNNTGNGHRLKVKIKNPASTSAFVGDNSRFAGAIVINNYETAAASYYAELTFDPGLALLETTVVMPRTFLNSDMYENSTTGVPYAMLQEGLTYGIWLNKKNYAKYYVDNDMVKLLPYGNSPLMIMKNEGTTYDFSVTGSTSNHDPRMVAGFEEMTLNVINSTKSYVMGTNPGVGFPDELFAKYLSVYPNPASDVVYCETDEISLLEIYSIDGKLLKRFGGQKRYEVNVADFDSGIYLFKATTGSNTVVQKVTVK
jgi:cyanophycinase